MQSNLDQAKSDAFGSCVGGQELGVHINMQIVHVKPVSKSYY